MSLKNFFISALCFVSLSSFGQVSSIDNATYSEFVHAPNIASISNDLDIAETDIVTLDAALTVAENNIIALDADLTTLENSVGSISNNYLRRDGTLPLTGYLNFGGFGATNLSVVRRYNATIDDYTSSSLSSNSKILDFSDNSFIAGGALHAITNEATESVIVGGLANKINGGARSVVVGGSTGWVLTSLESGVFSAWSSVIDGATNSVIVGGGFRGGNKIINASGAAVVGGGSNFVGSAGSISDYSSVFGGQNNAVESQGNSIVGGYGNSISGGLTYRSTVVGGGNNKILGSDSSDAAIVGGLECLVTNSYKSSIFGGWHNTITDSQLSAILGGQYLTVGGPHTGPTTASIAIGGTSSKVKGIASAVVAGSLNSVYGSSSVLLGGTANIISNASYSAIAAGSNNKVEGDRSGTLGGFGNEVRGSHSAAVGGYVNRTHGENSVILGGEYNTITNSSLATLVGGRDAIVSGSTNVVVINSRGTQFDPSRQSRFWNTTDTIGFMSVRSTNASQNYLFGFGDDTVPAYQGQVEDNSKYNFIIGGKVGKSSRYNFLFGPTMTPGGQNPVIGDNSTYSVVLAGRSGPGGISLNSNNVSVISLASAYPVFRRGYHKYSGMILGYGNWLATSSTNTQALGHNVLIGGSNNRIEDVNNDSKDLNTESTIYSQILGGNFNIISSRDRLVYTNSADHNYNSTVVGGLLNKTDTPYSFIANSAYVNSYWGTNAYVTGTNSASFSTIISSSQSTIGATNDARANRQSLILNSEAASIRDGSTFSGSILSQSSQIYSSTNMLDLNSSGSVVQGNNFATIINSQNTIVDYSDNAMVLGAESGYILGSTNAMVLGAQSAGILRSTNSFVIGGSSGSLASIRESLGSYVINGWVGANVITNSSYIGIHNSKAPAVYNSSVGTIIGSDGGTVDNTDYFAIIGNSQPAITLKDSSHAYVAFTAQSTAPAITNSINVTLIGGGRINNSENSASYGKPSSGGPSAPTILSSSNCLSYSGIGNAISGSSYSSVFGGTTAGGGIYNSDKSTIFGSGNAYIRNSDSSGIFNAGTGTEITNSVYAIILSGQSNKLDGVTNSVILQGSGVVGTNSNTAYIGGKLNVGGVIQPRFLGVFAGVNPATVTPANPGDYYIDSVSNTVVRTVDGTTGGYRYTTMNSF